MKKYSIKKTNIFYFRYIKEIFGLLYLYCFLVIFFGKYFIKYNFIDILLFFTFFYIVIIVLMSPLFWVAHRAIIDIVIDFENETFSFKHFKKKERISIPFNDINRIVIRAYPLITIKSNIYSILSVNKDIYNALNMVKPVECGSISKFILKTNR